MSKPEIRALNKKPKSDKQSYSKEETSKTEEQEQSKSEVAQQPSKSPKPPKSPKTDTSQAVSSQEQDAAQEKKGQTQQNYYFQAIGVIRGEVTFYEEEKASIVLGGKEYGLFFPQHRPHVLKRLRAYIEQTGRSTQRLGVYPKVTHFPDKETRQKVEFQVFGFEKEEKGDVFDALNDQQFRLAGLWQFIPVCKLPCISIYKNINKQRLKWIKKASPKQKMVLMKASHLPMLWKDAPVKPFRYNPKAEEQGKPAFVQVRAKFLPGKDLFAFESLLAPPIEKPPKHLKLSKKDKQAVQQREGRQKQQKKQRK